MSLMLKKKGGKQFKPKLPSQRSVAPSSVLPSVDRQSQTPVPPPHPPSQGTEAPTLPADESTGIPGLADDPSSSAPAETTLHQAIIEHPKDADPLTQSSSVEEASTRNISAHAHNSALPLDKESMKGKTPDGVEGLEGVDVEGARKRHQPSSLDAPISPPQPILLEPSQPTEIQTESLKRKTPGGVKGVEGVDGEGPRKRHQPSTLDAPRSPPQPMLVVPSQTTESQIQLAEPSEPAQLSTSETPSAELQDPESSQLSKATPPRTDVLPDEISTTVNLPNIESSQPTAQVSTATQQHHLRDDVQVDPVDESDSELTTTGLRPAGGASSLGAAGDVGSGAEGAQSAQTPVIVPTALLNPDGTPGELVQQPPTGTKKKAPRRRKVQEAENGDDVRPTVEMQLDRPRRVRKKRNKKDDANKKSKRGETPEGAEEEEVNRKEMTMADLCKDPRIGQKFSRHDELRQRERQRVIKARLARNNSELASMVEGGEGAEGGPQGSDEERTPAEVEAEQPVNVGGGVKMRIIDGQIVMDETSMQINRQARAQAEQGEMEEVEENEFSKIITSGTYMKRERIQLWDMAANETFWKGLRMFGTDFEMIAKMFPHRNRRQIKLKFNKEERDNAWKIDKILKGQGNAIELDTYEELSGVKLEEVADIEAERERVEAEHKAEEDRRLAEIAEVERKKKAVIARRKADDGDESGDDDDGPNGDSGRKENRPGLSGQKTYVWSKASKGKKDGTGGKPKKKRGGADETVEVLGDA